MRKLVILFLSILGATGTYLSAAEAECEKSRTDSVGYILVLENKLPGNVKVQFTSRNTGAGEIDKEPFTEILEKDDKKTVVSRGPGNPWNVFYYSCIEPEENRFYSIEELPDYGSQITFCLSKDGDVEAKIKQLSEKFLEKFLNSDTN